MTAPDLPRVEVRSRTELRDWLTAHHAKGQSVWLITWKKHSDSYLAYDEIVDELLCWGWVDSRTLRVDSDRSGLLIAPRNPASAWSAANKARIARLQAQGRMMPAGEALVAAAKVNGMWRFLDDVERLEMPEDLRHALDGLLEAWEAWPRSVRRGTLEWIKTAKRAETRAKRISEVAASARAGLRPAPFRR